MERQQNPFDTPVPGQSLTDIPKNYKWENPARFSKLEDSSLHIWKELNRIWDRILPNAYAEIIKTVEQPAFSPKKDIV